MTNNKEARKQTDTIGVAEVRALQQITQQLGIHLTNAEYAVINQVYLADLDRILNEAGAAE